MINYIPSRKINSRDINYSVEKSLTCKNRKIQIVKYKMMRKQFYVGENEESEQNEREEKEKMKKASKK